MKNRNEAIDAVKGFAILLVMIGHVLVHNKMEDPYLYNMIKIIQMPLFMCISGYINGCGSKVTTIRELCDKLRRRSISYLLPFFSWIIVMSIVNGRNIITGVLNTINQLERGLWFLMTLFILTSMTSIAEYAKYHTRGKRFSPEFIKNNKLDVGKDEYKNSKGLWPETIFLLVFFALSVLLLIHYVSGSPFLSPGLTVYYLPFYISGYYIADHKGFFKKISVRYIYIKNIFHGFAYFCGLLFLFIAIRYRFDVIASRSVLLLQIVASFLGCIFFMKLFLEMKANRITRFLSFIGKYTLEIYVLHFHFASILNTNKTTYNLYSIKGSLYASMAFLVMSVITAVLILVLKRIPFLNLLLFGRK